MDSPRLISPTIDADLVRMESQLDSWCLDMKRNILVSDLINVVVFCLIIKGIPTL